MAHTHIGYGSPHKHDTFQAHGEPLGAEEVRLTKRCSGWPEDAAFLVPEEALAKFRKAVNRGRSWKRPGDTGWRYRQAYPEQARELERCLDGKLP